MIFSQTSRTYIYENPSWDARQPQNTSGSLPMAAENGNEVENGVLATDYKIKIIKEASKKYGIDWKIVYAICEKETRCNPDIDCKTKGGHCDNYTSVGAYQIHRPAHPDVTDEHAKNFKWSTDFTANRLKKNEWRGEDEMIRSHNGLYADHRNDYYVEDVKKIMKSL